MDLKIRPSSLNPNFLAINEATANSFAKLHRNIIAKGNNKSLKIFLLLFYILILVLSFILSPVVFISFSKAL